jgi:hypothetical protein
MIIRYGDDILVGLQHPDDAKCVRADMQDRLARRDNSTPAHVLPVPRAMERALSTLALRIVE